MHRPLEDRDPGSLGSVIHHEDGALRGDQAIIGGHVETAGRTMRGADNDVPAIQMDGGAAPPSRDGKLRALVHLDLGTIAEFDLGARVFAGAKFISIAEFVSGGNQPAAAIGNIESRAINARDRGPWDMLARQEAGVPGEDSDGDASCQRASERPSKSREVLAFHSLRRSRGDALGSCRSKRVPAGDALVQVIFHQESAGWSQSR